MRVFFRVDEIILNFGGLLDIIDLGILRVENEEEGMAEKYPNGVMGSFYVDIYELVEDPSSDPIISWNKGNNGFVMCSQEERIRSKILMPFYCGKLCEFLSELSYYGFRRVKKKAGSGKLEFRNEDFVRGQPKRLKDMMLKASRKRKAKFRAQQATKDAVDRLQLQSLHV
ncbi:PREDICTED: heat stress transcription factor A-4a-like [Camelina sativa]|uniref:Heat stress transcription factor A-4a-like n=1 Tax=Camelina sativa TaxID=90675 RepID=A0ABM0V1A0_CAMSA|nr:PREDICTED: heat stress transcription factor A-4a-like [Camelina sativa]